ncbi:MAG: DEAD/DEAH box helicase family protein [bacterium]
MSLKTYEFKRRYKTYLEDVIEEFYNPCLSNAINYYRTTAYFTAGILLKLSIGLIQLAQNKGKIKMIISHQIKQVEYDAILNGEKAKVEDKFNSLFDENEFSSFEQRNDRFGLLSYLIQKDILEIKVAYLITDSRADGILHTKTGIFVDRDDNMVAMTGSANDTYNAFTVNYEDISVFCSWKNSDLESRCIDINNDFEKLWNNKEDGVLTLDFPEIVKNRLMKYHKATNDYTNLDKELLEILLQIKLKSNREEKEMIGNEEIKLHDYQEEAICQWENNDYNGILDMATGTGKTFTALGAICKLHAEIGRLFVVICVPYTHLVEQWSSEAKLFNIDVIKCYDSFNKYKANLKSLINNFKMKRKKFGCIIITNSSFTNENIQSLLISIANDTMFIVDEAHNFGAPKISKTLEVNYKYRLGLSATIHRHNDNEGTEKIINYFDKIIFSYSLERAIQEDKLTKYYYFPIVSYFNSDELDRYIEVTKKINTYHYDRKSNSLPSGLKSLLIKRARIVAETKSKINNLIKIIKENDLEKEKNMLFYCGAVSYEEDIFDDEDKRQIEVVINELQSNFNMEVSKFTADESNEVRKEIINSFVDQDINGIVAIKCLDEGVNIPCINRAFILASSTNPKEYIQRRGRVLRKAKGKIYSEIYDFISLPRLLISVDNISEQDRKIDLSLVKREFDRIKCFSKIAINSRESFKLIEEIEQAYELNIIREEDLYE